MSSDAVIVADRLTRRFGSFTAVNAISFEVRRGEIFGFLGANGAGKTTAIKMMSGLLMPSDGTAVVGGFDVSTHAEDVKRSIGYMSQRFSLYADLTIRENIEFYGGIYGLKKADLANRAQHLLDDLGLHDDADRLVGELPLGLKQKLAFSTALVHNPKVVFLDEPTSGVDPLTRRQFWEMIYAAADRGTTILITTHYLDEAEYCNRISVMVDGTMAAYDTPAAVKAQLGAATMDEVFLTLTRSSS